MNRIICIGNRYVGEDASGPLVYDVLCQSDLPFGVEIVDGGLGGLNLLSFFEDVCHVVFVDNVHGFSNDGPVVILKGSDIETLHDNHYGHDAGLPYLLKMLSHVIQGELPRISLVGVEGPASAEVIKQAADTALFLAAHHHSFTK